MAMIFIAAMLITMTMVACRYPSRKRALFRLPQPFLEIFSVGLVVALVAAAVLRNSKVLPAQ